MLVKPLRVQNLSPTAEVRKCYFHPFPYCPFRFRRLLPHVIRNIRQVAFVGKNRRKVVSLSDEIQGAQRFPHLFG